MRKPGLFTPDWQRITVNLAVNPTLKLLEGRTVAEIANERGQDGLDVFFDLAIEDNLELRYIAMRADIPEALIDDPRTMIGISDGGAHVDQLCDAGYCTDLIGTFVRGKQVLSLERESSQDRIRAPSRLGNADGVRDFVAGVRRPNLSQPPNCQMPRWSALALPSQI
jgi:N-acyl-D-aspartate/D-glutamate deacylase